MVSFSETKQQFIFVISLQSHAKWSGTSDFLFNGKIKKIEGEISPMLAS